MDRAGKAILVLLAVGYLLIATQLAPPYFLADIVEAAPSFWEFVFSAAGLSCLACAWWPRRWYGWVAMPWVAGALVSAAAGSRGVALVFVAASDPTVSFVPVLGWTMIFGLQAYAWPHIAPYRMRRRNG